jgi:hypothetical protein
MLQAPDINFLRIQKLFDLDASGYKEKKKDILFENNSNVQTDFSLQYTVTGKNDHGF